MSFVCPRYVFPVNSLKAKKTANGQRGLTMKQDAKWARLPELP